MKVEALSLAQQTADPNTRLNILREYLQVFSLRSWHEQGAFASLSMVGGTALHLIFGLPRFSEDLDFSLIAPQARYDPATWQKKLKTELELSGFKAQVSWKEEKTVAVGWVKIEELLWEAGITMHKQQRLAIKIEVDTNPPTGAVTEKRILATPFMWGVRHHNLASLMAGKINAILTRPYTKGRDWFDLLWYLSQTPPIQPNLGHLKASLAQTGVDYKHHAQGWVNLILTKLTEIEWNKVIQDLQPLIARPADLKLLTIENIKRALANFQL